MRSRLAHDCHAGCPLDELELGGAALWNLKMRHDPLLRTTTRIIKLGSAAGSTRWISSSTKKPRIPQTDVPVDEDGIPLSPPYSIRSLLSSLPAPVLSDKQFVHLHTLSSLHPPPAGSAEYSNKKAQLEEMIRLVEAVRIQPDCQDAARDGAIPDGRIWPEPGANPDSPDSSHDTAAGISLDWTTVRRSRKDVEKAFLDVGEGGKDLLKLASKQTVGYYTAPRRQSGDIE